MQIVLIKPPNHITPNHQRFLEVDGLKGFAICAILAYHCITHFNFPNTVVATNDLIAKTDSLVSRLAGSLLFGKIYLIFSLLFGFTFYLQIQRQKEKGTYKVRKTLLRILLLFAFGIINSLFFPDGDILVIYALIAILLIPLIKLSTKALCFIALVLLLQPFQLLAIYKITNDPSFVMPVTYSDILKDDIINTIRTGSVKEIIVSNITKGPLASIVWSFESGRLTQMMGAFIYGVIAARISMFDSRLFKKTFWIGLFIFSSFFFLLLYFQKQQTVNNSDSGILHLLVSLTFSLWLNLFFAFGVIASFVFSFNTFLKKLLKPFTYIGKMSLTNYILQSIIGALIFLPFGLNMAVKIGTTYSLFLSIFIGAGLMLFSRKWLNTHRSGPLETAWAKTINYS